MFVSQPQIPVPLAIEFPFPAWATRLSECALPLRGPGAQPLRGPGALPLRGPGAQPLRGPSAGPTGDLMSRLPPEDDIPPF
jgi:hypothetical protein